VNYLVYLFFLSKALEIHAGLLSCEKYLCYNHLEIEKNVVIKCYANLIHRTLIIKSNKPVTV